nr:hypothetical protein [Marinicella sp. W31]MDC2877288.1 hypothetical protein [Marinicella sp. W31]
MSGFAISGSIATRRLTASGAQGSTHDQSCRPPAGQKSGRKHQRRRGRKHIRIDGGAINLFAERIGGIENIVIRNVALSQRPGPYRTAFSYDLRPTPADLEASPEAEGRINAWRKGADGRVIGLVDYTGGMPALFAYNIKGLHLENIDIERPEPLPEGFNTEPVIVS